MQTPNKIFNDRINEIHDKKNDAYCDAALQFIQRNFENTTYSLGEWGDAFPAGLDRWEGDYILSYLSRWIVPAKLLKKAKKAALNFHPARTTDRRPAAGRGYSIAANTAAASSTCRASLRFSPGAPAVTSR